MAGMRWIAFSLLCLAAGCDSGAGKGSPNPGSGAPSAAPVPARESFTWLTDEAKAYAQARASNKAVVIDFFAEWAAPCVELDKLLSEPDIVAALSPHFVPVRIDVTEDRPDIAALRERYNAASLPFLRFVDIDGSVLATLTTLPTREDLRATIDRAISRRKPAAAASGSATR
jgi:thiol:disulfide interchange protein DsbD